MKTDAIKAFKKANREIELENKTGWTCKNKVHKSKKTYDRKSFKKQIREN